MCVKKGTRDAPLYICAEVPIEVLSECLRTRERACHHLTCWPKNIDDGFD